ncbi:MurR/RpiR family transcriptional regulator [Pacificibacter marinus]|uniref:Putative HTH-type transcriptional regulator YbbH n=1 Tax=Pacificibacter marinus TaxID=658057 RepID=A0A1Y5R7K0_9RHOB|nr:MurR/RpiR family transcriptional regulator [Pacificibacter marinus]SEK28753.1 transcriptional regulator, RpiR family [Pacificibacter marinus]SLN10946.1 putative HTH-type transcriptional regulator YbbH [Pacificibacter marinus]
MSDPSKLSLAAGTTSAGNLIVALADEDGKLSAMERKLAESVLADVNYATNASIIDIATRAGVSPPTVTRFCRRLGCASFSDFKVQLAKSAYVGLRYLKPEAVTTTPAQVAEDIVTKAQNALYEMHRTLDLDRVNAAVDLLSKAEMIYAFGSGGNSSMIVNELQNRLFRLGARISASNDHGMNLMLSAAAQPGTVVFGSSVSGRNEELISCFELLRERGIPTIALTQDGSPLADVADVVIPINLPEGRNIFRATSTRYASLAVVDIIANLVAYQDRAKSTRILRGIKEQLVKQRDGGDDSQILGD